MSTATGPPTPGQRERRSSRPPTAGHPRGLGLKREVSTYLGRDRRPRDQLHPHRCRVPTARTSWPGWAATGPTCSAARTGCRSPRTWPPTSSPSNGPRRCSRPRRPTGSSARIPRPGCRCRSRPGRFGPYVQLGELVDGGPKPRTSSLFASMSPATITFEQALDLLRIPRVVGTDPQTGEEIVAHNGKFGPYLKTGHRHPQPAHRGPDPVGDRGRGPGPVRPAQGPWRSQCQGAAPRDGGRSRHRPGHGGQGRSVRSLCDRRHHQRLAAEGRRRRVPHRGAGRRAAGRATGGRAVDPKKAAKKKAPAKKTAAKKATAKKTTAKKAPAKKAATAKAAAAKKAPASRGCGRFRRRGPVVEGGRWPTGSPDRARGNRRLRQVHPGPAAGRTAGRPPDLRTGRHQVGVRPPPAASRTGDQPPVSERAEALLMAADRAQHVAEVVMPALDAGTWVVTDRFSASTLAYQGYGRGLDRAELAQLIRWATGGVDPDLTVLIDVPVALASRPAERQRRRPARGRGRRRSSNGWPTGTGVWPQRRRRPGWWSTAPGRWTRWRRRCGRGSATSSAPGRVAVTGDG